MRRRAPGAMVAGMNSSIDPGARIGHVHLKVADLDRAVAFYRDVLGFGVTGQIGDQIAFLAAGDYHHHIGLNALESRDGDRPAAGTTGLYHAAIAYPTRASLARAVQRVLDHGHPVSHGSDHGANEAVYLQDPDGNGLELYWDRPIEEWPRAADGRLAAGNLPLDLDALLAAAQEHTLRRVRRAADGVRHVGGGLAPLAQRVGADDVGVGRVRPAHA